MEKKVTQNLIINNIYMKAVANSALCSLCLFCGLCNLIYFTTDYTDEHRMKSGGGFAMASFLIKTEEELNTN